MYRFSYNNLILFYQKPGVNAMILRFISVAVITR